MKIKTLIITSFGKFRNCTIELDDGFNLVYGENEAGKSTVQHFIEGMFFGFFKPYRKKKTYSEDYERFKPQNDYRYFGSLVYDDESGREIKLERNFLRGEESLIIYDGLTGLDISKDYPYDPVIRQYLPLGNEKINSVLYNNTVNFVQSKTATGEDLANLINDRLVDAGAVDYEELSVFRAVSYLGEQKRKIGGRNQSRSHYGEAVIALHSLEEELASSERIYSQIWEKQKKLATYRKDLIQAQNIYNEMLSKDEEEKQSKIDKMEERIASIAAEGEKLKEKINACEKYNQFSNDELNRLESLDGKIELIDEQLTKTNNQLAALGATLVQKETEKNHLMEKVRGLSLETLKRDLKEEQIKTAANAKEVYEEKPVAAQEIPEETEKKSQSLIIPIVIMMIGWVLNGLFVANILPLGYLPSMIMSLVGWIAIIGSILWIVLGRKKTTALPKKKPKEKEPITVNEVFEPYQLNGLTLEEFVAEKEVVFNKLDHIDLEIQNIKVHRSEIMSEKKTSNSLKEGYSTEYCEILAKVSVEDIESYKQGILKKQELVKLKNDYNYNSRLYEELKSGEVLSHYYEKSFTDNEFSFGKAEERYKAKEKIMTLNRNISGLQGEINQLTKSGRNPVELKEEIEAKRNAIDSYNADIKAYDLAMDVFRRLSNNKYIESVPVLNEKIGKLFYKITNYYKEVKVDEKLQIKVVNPRDGRFLAIEELSGGTIDQLYFAMRFGIENTYNTGVKLPYILDDTLVQYDQNRKAKAVEYLVEVSKTRQVIVFTCNRDEKRILDKGNFAYSGLILE